MLEIKSIQYATNNFNHSNNVILLRYPIKGVIKILEWCEKSDSIFGCSSSLYLNVVIDKSDEKMKYISLLLTKDEFDSKEVENLQYLGMYNNFAIWFHSISDV